MTRSASIALDFGADVNALLVIGSILWLGSGLLQKVVLGHSPQRSLA